MSESKISRRDSLKTVLGAAAGLVVGGAAGYLLKPEAPACPAAGSAVTSAVTSTVTSMATATAAQGPTKYKIIICGWNPGIDANATGLMRGTQDAAKQLNTDARFVYSVKYSMEDVTAEYESAIAAGPDAVAFIDWFPDAFLASYQKAKDKGIKVVTMNVDTPWRLSGDKSWQGLDIGFVGQNEVENGHAVTLRCLQEFTPKRCLIMTSNAAASYSVDRTNGSMQAFKQQSPQTATEVLALQIAQDPSVYYQQAKAYCQRHPDTDLILAWQPEVLVPAMQFVKDNSLVGKVRLAGTDVRPEIMDAIQQGVDIAATSQQFYYQAYLSVVWLYNYLEVGFIPPPYVSTGPTVIDKNTLDLIRKQVQYAGSA